MCQRQGNVSAAFAVDHIIPHKGDLALVFDYNNLQSLCEHCHNAVKQRIDRVGYDKAIALDGWPMDAMHPANQRK
jgi:5-methylcytosine-specific restriction endonuclease McrA